MKKMKLNLLDNGLDYIYEGIRPIFVSQNYSQVALKYSILHVYSGIQLLLKERLKQDHWSLIFQDINVASQQRLEAGNFVSVYHDELIKRLRNISKVTINEEPISNLRDFRNRFEHFEVNVSIDECERTLASALEVAVKFWTENLSNKATKRQLEKFGQIKSIIMGYEVYVAQRLDKFKEAIAGIKASEHGAIVYCPTCGSSSFAIFKDQSKKCKCFVCDEILSKEAYLELVRDREESSKNFSFIPYESYDINCSICNCNSRVRYEVSDDLTLYCCIECLNKERVSKEELRSIEFQEWLEEFNKNHSDVEVLNILKKQLDELKASLDEEL